MRILLMILCVLSLAHPAAAGWELYDDFNTGTTLNTDLWEPRGDVSIENGTMKMHHSATNGVTTADRVKAFVKDTTVKGVRFQIRVESWSDFVEGENPFFRMEKTFGDYTGPDGFDVLYGQVSLHGNNATPDEYALMTYYNRETVDPASYQLRSHSTISQYETFTQTWRTMEVLLADNGMQGTIDGLTHRVHFLDDYTATTDEPFKFTIRAQNEGDTYTAYIDDVYVYRGTVDDFTFDSGKSVVIPMF